MALLTILRRARLLASLMVMGLTVPLRSQGESIVFPPDAGVIDVTRAPYFARGDGVTDDTEAIQQALLEQGGNNRILYFPNGVYRISNTLRWPSLGNEATRGRQTILQGQSRTGTIIQLLDYTEVFGNSGRPRPLIWTGEGGSSRIRNALRNLTLHTGVGNPGAIGVQFMTNEQGGLRDVNIIAGGNGAGATGLDLAYTERIGPLLLKNVWISGFDTAIRTGHPVHSLTAEDLDISGQALTGIRNNAQVVTLRRLRSTNAVTAVQNSDNLGFVTLLDSTLQGLPNRRPAPATLNRGVLFIRNTTAPGYTNLIENRAGHGTSVDSSSGSEIREWVSHPHVHIFAAPPYTLSLPVEETPEIPWDPLSAWAGPQSYDGKPNDNEDDAPAIQAAAASGASTLYLPNGTWIIRQPVEIGPGIRRIIGCEARILIATPPGEPAFWVRQPSAEPLIVERLEIDGLKSPLVELDAERTVVFSSCHGVSLSWKSKGTVFLEDVASFTPWTLEEGQRLFARQWAHDFEGTKLINRGGTAWLMGLKTERAGTLVATSAQGRTEVLGGLVVSSGGWKATPMFRLENASATFVIAESSLNSAPFQTIVEEIRQNVTRRMSSFGVSGDLTLPQRVGGVAIPLYTGYDGVGAVEPRTSTRPGVRTPPR